jgi:hypothetical protein
MPARQRLFMILAMSISGRDGPVINANADRAVEISILITIALFLCQTGAYENVPDLDAVARTSTRGFPRRR